MSRVRRRPLSLVSSLLCSSRRGHGGGLHRRVRPGRDKPPPLPAPAGAAGRRRCQRGEPTRHVHGLPDRAAPPQPGQGEHEGVLHLTLWHRRAADLLTSEGLEGLTAGRAAAGSFSFFCSDKNTWPGGESPGNTAA